MIPTKEELIHLHVKNRISLAKLAKQYGLSRWKMHNLSHDIYKISSPYRVKNWIDKDEVKRLYISGVSALEIAKKFNVSLHPIYWIIKKAGITRTISIALKDKTIWKGRKHKWETRQKISKARMGKYTGMHNPNWKGGIKHTSQYKRLGFEYSTWRREIKHRDRKCLECNTVEKLVAHHIVPVRNIKDLFLLTDMNNGITLCKKCHKKTIYREEKYEIFYRALLAKAVKTGKP